VAVTMPAGLGAWREPPLGDDNALVLEDRL
jgi:hypothetical protein